LSYTFFDIIFPEMEGVYRMNKFIMSFCVIFFCVLTVSCGKSEKAAIQEAESLVNEFNHAKEFWQWEKMEQASDRLLQCAEQISRQPEKNRFLIEALEAKGSVYFQKKDYKKAFPYFERAYSYYDSVPRQDVFSRIDSVMFLYRLAIKSGRKKEAETYWAQAEKLIEQIQVEARTNTNEPFQKNYKFAVSGFINHKMETFIGEEKYKEALAIPSELFRLYGNEENFRDECYSSFSTFSNMALCYSELGNYALADHYYELNLTTSYQRHLFPTIPYWEWIKSYIKRKEYATAMKLVKKTMQDITHLELRNKENAIIYVNAFIALLYKEMGKKEDAKKYAEEALRHATVLGPEAQKSLEVKLSDCL